MKFNNSNMHLRLCGYNVKNKIINVQLKLCEVYRHVFLLYFVPGISTNSLFLIIVSSAPVTTTTTAMASTNCLGYAHINGHHINTYFRCVDMYNNDVNTCFRCIHININDITSIINVIYVFNVVIISSTGRYVA